MHGRARDPSSAHSAEAALPIDRASCWGGAEATNAREGTLVRYGYGLGGIVLIVLVILLLTGRL